MSVALKNFYEDLGNKDNRTYNNPNSGTYLISHPYRCLICGCSGTGKSNTLLNLIDKLNNMERFYLFVKLMGDDPLYDEVLVRKLQDAEQKHGIPILMQYSCDLEDLPDVRGDEVDSRFQNLFVFDDMLDEDAKSLKKISAYFTKMRKKNCSLVFVGQDYFQTPKPIRRNCNIFIFTKSVSEKDLRQIHQDLAREMTFEEFKKMFKAATDRGNILVIDPMHPEKKYRENFTRVLRAG